MRVISSANASKEAAYTLFICVGHRIAAGCFGHSTITRTLVERVATILLPNSLGQTGKGRDQSRRPSRFLLKNQYQVG